MSGTLTNLFNLSFSKSILPSDWKLSLVKLCLKEALNRLYIIIDQYL